MAILGSKKETLGSLVGMFIILTMVLSGCGGSSGSDYGGSGGTTTTVTSTVEVVACPLSGTTDVSIVNATTGFSDANITVPVNSVIKWTNNDSILHTVTSTTVPPDGAFDSGSLSAGTAFCLKFTAAGTFNYHCSIHPATMIGSVTVQ